VEVAVVPSIEVTVLVSFKIVGAVAAADIDCAVVTQEACANSGNSVDGSKAADNVTNNAAISRNAFIVVSFYDHR
jgi:hypothetical protein